MKFKALNLTKNEDASTTVEIQSIAERDLALGYVKVKISYSCLNYKDALAITNKAPIARTSPLILGIDGVGTIVETKDSRYIVGQKVILNGYEVGEKYDGCLAEYANLKADWLIPLPKELSEWQAMAIGTAGYTASLSVLKLIQHQVKPEDGEILVTGATGGVGSIAIILLAKLGYKVVAATGKKTQDEYLTSIGASRIIYREQLNENNKPLQKETWIAAIDTLGSQTLANICAQTARSGIVASCGLAQGMDFPSSVAPFILRGITLAGIDSVMASHAQRLQAWDLLAKNIDQEYLSKISKTITLSDCIQAAENIISGNNIGRYVVDLENNA